MKFENTWTGNWEGAFHGLRHPMESYDKSDSQFGIAENDIWLSECIDEVLNSYEGEKEFSDEEHDEKLDWFYDNGVLQWGKHAAEFALIGKNDMDLAQRMIKAGTPNDKFLRQIFVSVDITGPLYWWKEMDTYKVGTTADSTSTMHKLASTPITKECFEMDDYNGDLLMYEREPYDFDQHLDEIWECHINDCETLRKRYLETKDIRYWKELIRMLPESWLQTRQWTANYAVLRNIIHWRKGHKLTEWQSFIDWCHTLPYAEELLFFDN